MALAVALLRAAGIGIATAWCAEANPGAATAVDPRNAELALTLEGARGGAGNLAVRLVTAWGAVQDARVTEPAGVDLTSDAGSIEGDRIRVGLNGTGRTPGRLSLNFAVKGREVTGSYTGVWIKVAVQGAVRGAALPGAGRIEAGLPPPLELAKASYFGTAADDNFEGAAVGPDGALYLVGNAGAPVERLPGDVAPNRFGGGLPEALCGCGFVLKLSSDASRVLGYAELGKGIIHATAVAVVSNAVYVGGYASDGLEALLKERKGLIPGYPLRTEQKLIRDGKMMEANGQAAGKPDPISGRPWLGRLGAPCALRFSADLKTLESGTYLEGWQQVYDKNRNCGRDAAGNRRGPFHEYFWQPINVCPLAGGDVAVSHDGGYFRMLTDKDREAAAKLDTAEDKAKSLERLCFYDTADYVSRLSGDLTQRRWKTDIRTPPTDPEVAGRLKKGWALPYFGNPRVHRMRADREENLWVAGWSATLTSSEPWWSPFLWRLDPKSGEPTRRLYEYDPMSGGGNRMGGTVADTALLSVAVEDGGNLLTCLISDGGNCVMGWGPRGNEGKRMTGPVTGPGLGGSPAHFWGQAHRVDGKTFDGLGGAKTGPYAWTIDVAGLPDNHFLALGRWNAPLPWTDNAWWKNGAAPNPNAFLRVVAPDYNTVFWTAIPGVRPFELMPIGGERYIVVGFADKGVAPAKGGLVAEAPGGEDAWFGIVKWRKPAPLEVIRAGFFGTPEDDDIQSACAAPDGTIYIAGNAGAALPDFPGCKRFAPPAAAAVEPRCGRGFVAHLSADGGKVLHCVELPGGVGFLTTVQCNSNGVYVAGYASEALAPLLAKTPGLMREYPLAEEVRLIKEGRILEANGHPDPTDPLAGAPGLGRYGAPCVLRLSHDLRAIEAGTYLEGWQQVWNKSRVMWFWQPTSLALLSSGDVLVCHDGGYFRLLTDQDRKQAMAHENPEVRRDMLRRFGFYNCRDYVSRLSADLSQRVWRKDIYTPPTDAETVARLKNGWPHPHLSNPRTHQMRLDSRENVYLGGWSASTTSNESWWSPYVWKLNAADGGLIWKAYEYDPLSGGGNRLGGQVSDTAVVALAPDAEDNLLTSLIADGGNTVMGNSPVAELGRGFEAEMKGSKPHIRGVVHFHGQVHRVNGQTRQGLGGAKLGSEQRGGCGPAWVVDLAPLPGTNVLALGQCRYNFAWTEDAWQRADPAEFPTGFLRAYDPDFDLLFSAALPGVWPFAIAPLGEGRYAIVGRADRAGAPVKDAPFAASAGKADGYFMLARWIGPGR